MYVLNPKDPVLFLIQYIFSLYQGIGDLQILKQMTYQRATMLSLVDKMNNTIFTTKLIFVSFKVRLHLPPFNAKIITKSETEISCL